jgi:sugar O-acyltransferase (sialic acid O-acetyltransferase NeuD family)
MMKVAILGGRGGGEIAADILCRCHDSGSANELVGYLNDQMQRGEQLLGGEIIGRFDDWSTLPADVHFLAPLHKAKEMQRRLGRIEELRLPDHRLGTLIDPSAVVAGTAEISKGAILGALSIVGPSVRLGRMAALWPAAQLGHDVRTEDFVFVGRAAIVSGYCTLERACYIGSGVVVREGCRIGRFAVVGAGSTVLEDVPDHEIVAGNPARRIRVRSQRGCDEAGSVKGP